MSPTHEFGIIENIINQQDFQQYNPEKYNCISVDDEVVESLVEKLLGMKSYFHSLDRPELGLAYHGVTIIPPDSLIILYNILTSSIDFGNSEEFNELALKIQLAIQEKKYMIHYGL